jgi:hypothetical protein
MELRIYFFSCEAWDRTKDLRVMSPTSYRCSTSHRKSKVLALCSQIIYICASTFFYEPQRLSPYIRTGTGYWRRMQTKNKTTGR